MRDEGDNGIALNMPFRRDSKSIGVVVSKIQFYIDANLRCPSERIFMAYLCPEDAG